jgi:2-oxoglutarate ferredoxin oxidoreductase subunit gamma
MIIRLGGFGGQGIVMAGYILGNAGLLDGGNALQTQSYGSEARGGASKSDVIISRGEILELAASDLDVLVAMSQPALDKFNPCLKEGGTLIYESDLVHPRQGNGRSVGLPATDMAQNKFKLEVVANVIMLGCLVGYTDVVSRDATLEAIKDSIPVKSQYIVDVNLQAFEEGYQWGAERKEG